MNKKVIIFISLLFLVLGAGFYIHRLAQSNKSQVIIELDRDEILNAKEDDYSSDAIVHWDSYKQYEDDVNDGNIPVDLLSDPVYCSMNLPSESRSDFMIGLSRDNAHIVGDTSSELTKTVIGIGAFYLTSGETLPEKFSIYLGKMKVFAYSKSKHAWVTLDSIPYPAGIYIYTLPWDTAKAFKCENITYTDDYAKIDLTSEEMTGNVLHFWGNCEPINKKDYLYYACAYDFWVSDNAVGTLTAMSGIDAKDANGYEGQAQLFTSRGYSVASTKKTIWGHTIPNSEYKNSNASILNELYAEEP